MQPVFGDGPQAFGTGMEQLVGQGSWQRYLDGTREQFEKAHAAEVYRAAGVSDAPMLPLQARELVPIFMANRDSDWTQTPAGVQAVLAGPQRDAFDALAAELAANHAEAKYRMHLRWVLTHGREP